MDIPKKFKLFGIEINVVYDDKIIVEKSQYGVTNTLTDKITLQNSNGSVTQMKVDQTFCHELVHHILNAMGEHKLIEDEKFVEVFSGLLHQSIETSEY